MKLNIDTNSFRQASSENLSASTSQLIVLLEDGVEKHGVSKIQTLVNKLNDALENQGIEAILSDTNNAGRPIAAIGAGSPSGNGQSAIDDLREQVRNSGLPQKVKIGVENLINPNSPGYLHLDADGTPSLIVQLKNEKEAATAELAREKDLRVFGTLAERLDSAQKALENERDPNQNGTLAERLDSAQKALENERDPNQNGSLAQQLAAAVPYDRAALRADLGELQTSIQSQSTKRGSKTVDGNGRVMDSFTKVVRRLGFQPSS